MLSQPLIMVVGMLLLSADEAPTSAWKDKVPAAVERAGAAGTVSAFQEALDVAWRADDWQAGLSLTRQVLQKHPDEARLRGLIVRALWRAGHLEQAERLATLVPPATNDRCAVRALIDIHLARGEDKQAAQWTERLEKLGPKTADDLYHLFSVRFAQRRYEGLADLLRKAEPLISAEHGYPENYLAESVQGLATYLDAVGTEPLNQITRHGSAPMTALAMINLPSCDALINGQGPYRMIIDTGGSIILALDDAVADELGLKSIATATVRGVSGKQDTGQALVGELEIGTITCTRVLTRIFPVREAIMNSADGIIGTGIFASARMTLDFAQGQITTAPSDPKPAPGSAVDLRIVGDAKLMALVTLEGQPAIALLDTGAEAVAVAPSRLKQLFPDRKIRTFDQNLGVGIGAEGSPEISLGSGVDLVLAGRKYEKYGGLGLEILDTILSPIIGVQTDILIGMPTFRDARSCTVDFPRCKMWIDWLER